jgi:hypothetical protein
MKIVISPLPILFPTKKLLLRKTGFYDPFIRHESVNDKTRNSKSHLSEQQVYPLGQTPFTLQVCKARNVA